LLWLVGGGSSRVDRGGLLGSEAQVEGFGSCRRGGGCFDGSELGEDGFGLSGRHRIDLRVGIVEMIGDLGWLLFRLGLSWRGKRSWEVLLLLLLLCLGRGKGEINGRLGFDRESGWDGFGGCRA
jgi:hypothetical protein